MIGVNDLVIGGVTDLFFAEDGTEAERRNSPHPGTGCFFCLRLPFSLLDLFKFFVSPVIFFVLHLQFFGVDRQSLTLGGGTVSALLWGNQGTKISHLGASLSLYRQPVIVFLSSAFFVADNVASGRGPTGAF